MDGPGTKVDNRDLTEKEYWDARQEDVAARSSSDCAKDSEWADRVAPLIRFDAPGPRRMLEFGCNPGHSSLALLHHLDLEAHGVDFNKHDQRFRASILKNHKRLGRVHTADVRQFHTEERFDLVFSCGFVEHFHDFEYIAGLHAQPVAPGGYALVVVPNFRGLQWVYHSLFDGPDLAQHNLASMDVARLSEALEAQGLSIQASGYAGPLRFWNYCADGGLLRRMFVRVTSKLVRMAATVVACTIPVESRWSSPWIYVLARRPEGQ